MRGKRARPGRGARAAAHLELAAASRVRPHPARGVGAGRFDAAEAGHFA